MPRARLIETRELAPETRHFDFEVPEASEFAFTPGQFISVVHQVEGKQITRAYSIASPRNGNRFSLCLNRVQDGLVSPYLFGLEPGAEIEVHEPLGYFTMRHPGHRAVFIATGTGIAPFRSILLDYLPRTEPHVTLLFGVRHEQGLLYREEFETLAKTHAHFTFIPTLTRPTEGWIGQTGRVQQHLDSVLTLDPAADIPTLDVYICGLKEMVDSVRRELKQRGFSRQQIIYEKYD